MLRRGANTPFAPRLVRYENLDLTSYGRISGFLASVIVDRNTLEQFPMIFGESGGSDSIFRKSRIVNSLIAKSHCIFLDL